MPPRGTGVPVPQDDDPLPAGGWYSGGIERVLLRLFQEETQSEAMKPTTAIPAQSQPGKIRESPKPRATKPTATAQSFRVQVFMPPSLS